MKDSQSEIKLPTIGAYIINQDKSYRVIGHGTGIPMGISNHELPLNSIDKKIIEYISTLDQQENDLHYYFDEHNPYGCSDNCLPLNLDIENYIDDVVKKIKIFSKQYVNKLEKDYYLLGFYRPFHFYTEWGIFIKATGQARRTRRLKLQIDQDPNKKYGVPSIGACYLISKTFTFFHEFYHHKVESLALKFELTTRLPYYTTGFHCLYCNTFNTDRCLEEAFAHTYAYFETCKNLYPYLVQMGITRKQLKYILNDLIIRNSPLGYSLAENIITSNNRQEAKNFEYFFFEAVLRYSHKLNTGIDLSPLTNEEYWRNFKHATHPILMFENEVTYVVDIDDQTIIQLNNFLAI